MAAKDGKKKNKKPEFQEISEWSEGDYTYKASAINSKKVSGMSFTTWKKVKWSDEPQFRKSFWIPTSIRVEDMLNWMYSTIKRTFRKMWGKNLITPEDLELQEHIVEDLRSKLKERESELDEFRHKFSEQQKELALAQELVEQLESFEEQLDKFEEMVIDSVSSDSRIEEEVKRTLLHNRWILGIDCEVRAKNRDIDPTAEVDMHITSNYGEDRVFEIKSPNLPLFSGKRGKRQDISSDLATALSETVEYLQRTQTFAQLRQVGPYKIDKPIGRILAGYKLEEAEKRLLDDWNFHLSPAIKIITYEELINNARKEIALIKQARRTSKN